jgi:hypothetical protein
MQNIGQEYQRDVAPRYRAVVVFAVISMGKRVSGVVASIRDGLHNIRDWREMTRGGEI